MSCLTYLWRFVGQFFEWRNHDHSGPDAFRSRAHASAQPQHGQILNPRTDQPSGLVTPENRKKYNSLKRAFQITMTSSLLLCISHIKVNDKSSVHVYFDDIQHNFIVTLFAKYNTNYRLFSPNKSRWINYILRDWYVFHLTYTKVF